MNRWPHSPHTLSGEAGPCFVCRRPCYPVDSGYFRHGALCGATMPRAGRCARQAGHRFDHRSEWAVAYDARRKVTA